VNSPVVIFFNAYPDLKYYDLPVDIKIELGYLRVNLSQVRDQLSRIKQWDRYRNFLYSYNDKKLRFKITVYDQGRFILEVSPTVTQQLVRAMWDQYKVHFRNIRSDEIIKKKALEEGMKMRHIITISCELFAKGKSNTLEAAVKVVLGVARSCMFKIEGKTPEYWNNLIESGQVSVTELCNIE